VPTQTSWPAAFVLIEKNDSFREHNFIQHLTFTTMFDPEKDRLHAINHRLDQLRGYL
jgi:hypothetical protein